MGRALRKTHHLLEIHLMYIAIIGMFEEPGPAAQSLLRAWFNAKDVAPPLAEGLISPQR
jgi:hypothetical protein